MHTKIKSARFIILIMFYAFISLGICGYLLAQPWFDPDWSYRSEVTIDNVGNSNSLTDYQARVELDGSNFDFSLAQTGGEDIRFTDSDGVTLLNYWIEVWDSANDSAVVWVRVPSIPALSYHVIYMYYGNLSASSITDPDQTF